MCNGNSWPGAVTHLSIGIIALDGGQLHLVHSQAAVHALAQHLDQRLNALSNLHSAMSGSTTEHSHGHAEAFSQPLPHPEPPRHSVS